MQGRIPTNRLAVGRDSGPSGTSTPRNVLRGPRSTSTPMRPRPATSQPSHAGVAAVPKQIPQRRSLLPVPKKIEYRYTTQTTFRAKRVVEPLGQSFHEQLTRKRPPSRGAQLHEESRVAATKIESELRSADPTPEIKNLKHDKAVRLVQTMAHKKAAERKLALETIKRRQDEAREKHSKAREKAIKIADAKRHMRSLGRDVNIEEVLALIREENKDIEEAASSGGIASSAPGGVGYSARVEVRHNASVMRGAAVRGAPNSPIATAQRAVIAETAQQIPRTSKETILDPEEVASVMVSPEKVVPALNTSLQVVKDQLSTIQEATENMLLATEDSPTPSVAEDKEEELMRGYATFFGGEKEMSVYMKEIGDQVRDWLDNVTADSMLLDESDIGDPEEFLQGIEEQKIALQHYRNMLRQATVTRVQLRGSQPPAWFPGYFTVLPQATPPSFQLCSSPSRCLDAAWQQFRPDEYTHNESIIK